MNSSLIGKIEKAKRYAQEPERINFTGFNAEFRGDNSNYSVSYKEGIWNCTCPFFSQRGICSHTMALQRLLTGMIPEDALSVPSGTFSD
ncbi:MAG: SWIM zinc finger family protein [Dehalococcoidia bacterium]